MQNSDGNHIVVGAELGSLIFYNVTEAHLSGLDYWVVKLKSMSGLSKEQIQSFTHSKIFPNPLSDNLRVLSKTKLIKEILLFDASGKQIQQVENLNTKE